MQYNIYDVTNKLFLFTRNGMPCWSENHKHYYSFEEAIEIVKSHKEKLAIVPADSILPD